MSLKKLLYTVLEQMVRSAKRGDNKKILSLNRESERLLPQVFPDLSDTSRGEYDNCRQSCVMSTDPKFAKMHDKFLADALQRFRRIPKP